MDVDIIKFLESLSDLINKVKNISDDMDCLERSMQYSIEMLLYLISSAYDLHDLLRNVQIIYELFKRSRRNVAPFLSVISTVAPLEEKPPGPGRPKYCIKEETLLEFRNLGFNWKQIANILLVSRWTVSRRVKELGIQDFVNYSSISDDELDDVIMSYKNNHGICVGRSLVLGHLR